MKKNHRMSIPAVGGSSLLVIFAVLCLTVFALLSLSTVMVEKRMADASAQAVQDYYAADLQAQAILTRLRAGEAVSGVQEEDGFYRYSCPITENQRLYAELTQDADGWHICRWQVVARSQSINDTLPVWDGK